MRDSNRNKISNVTGKDLKNGISLIDSSNNILSNITLVKERGRSYCVGMTISFLTSSHNTISDLICTDYSTEKENWGLQIDSEHCSVENSRCGPVDIGWSASATLTNVDCGELIQINAKAGDVSLTNCQGQKLHDPSRKVTTTNCNFNTGLGNARNAHA